jgi:hypothetical protein
MTFPPSAEHYRDDCRILTIADRGLSIMTALRMVRRGIIKGRQQCRGAPWVIKVEDMAAYRERKLANIGSYPTELWVSVT